MEQDLDWLEGRLRQAPDAIGDQVQGMISVYPVYKTRMKDSCCRLSASAGWRVYYPIDKQAKRVELFFMLHKKQAENAGRDFINQQIERAFSSPKKVEKPEP
jgi:hypothetical protein